jgi:three-Cys-motif partner protein
MSGATTLDPADGLPVRSVGEWSKRKHHFLQRYMDMFTRGMSRKWSGRLAYLDLFAGPGRWADEDDCEALDGSPLLAAKHGFDRLIFVDNDRGATTALSQRLDAAGAGRRAHVLTGDCNVLIDEVVGLLPPNGLTLAFIDPTNWQVGFDTMRTLAATRRVDVILTFQQGAMKRVAHLAQQPRVDRFFGTDAWRAEYARTRRLTSAELTTCYRNQMVGLGYLSTVSPDPPVVNSKHVLMYRLVFFSKNDLGYDFWRKACEWEETGQRSLNL